MPKPLQYTINTIKDQIFAHRAEIANLTTDIGYVRSKDRYRYQETQKELIKYEDCLETLKGLQLTV